MMNKELIAAIEALDAAILELRRQRKVLAAQLPPAPPPPRLTHLQDPRTGALRKISYEKVEDGTPVS